MPDRFHVTYLLTLDPGEDAEERIRALQLEQSAELPDGVVHALGMQEVTGSVTAVSLAGAESEMRPRQVQVTIAWPKNNHGNEITQFLNVLFGNISMKRGIAITDIRWEDVSGGDVANRGGTASAGDVASCGDATSGVDIATGGVFISGNEPIARGRSGLLAGPALGIDRIREKWGVHGRALACTALKPMGYSPEKLADLAYRFAMGGVDIIKDDHGLADQPTAPFADRVRLCMEAVDRAAQKTGRRSRYFPNITTDPHRVAERFELAADMGADGVLLIPMLVGPALMHHLARLGTDLPIMAHPAFSGSFIAHDAAALHAVSETGGFGVMHYATPSSAGSHSGHSHGAPPASTPSTSSTPSLHGFEPGLFYGGLMRALGADFTIYPNTGGRFSFSKEVCDAINSRARNHKLPFAPCFPAPGGGMQRDRMVFWQENYGADTTFLMGGSLFEDPAGIEAASLAFMDTLGA